MASKKVINMVRKDIPKARWVIGAIRDSKIFIGEEAFQILASGIQDKILTKGEVDFMVDAGCGGSWEAIQDTMPLFGMDEYNNPCFIDNGLCKPAEKPLVAPDEKNKKKSKKSKT